ncbi:MAG: carboxypeptidase regulatory-like domain-containing protein [Bryobacterales bacterium]|nr:carboxypeptidase regulatory-like domain-containing protein [Bryobacterales bacterium]
MRFVFIAIMISLLAVTGLFAADSTGSIAGRISDPSGASVAGAKVIATAAATGLVRETTSGTDGGFVIPLLPPGGYSLSVQASGFSSYERTGITVLVNATASVPVALTLGAVSEHVTVEANGDLVDTTSGTLRQTIDETKIMQLPLPARNAARLILLTPGTADLSADNARGAGDTTLTFRYPGAQSVTSSGSRADGINYQLDGGSNRDPFLNVNNPFPNPDALQEFSVQTNNFSAQYGSATGAVVSIVTKSGTNDYHGSAFNYLRNGSMNARNFFASNHDMLKRNQFGGTLGGPIVRNKLFFFGSYQGTVLRNISGTSSAIVPTDAQRRGDFSSFTKAILDPVSGSPFAGNQIPLSRFHPVSAELLPMVPSTTASDARIYYQKPANQGEQQVLGRVDYQTDRSKIYGRYFYSRYMIDPVMGTNTDLLKATIGYRYLNQGFAANHSYTFSPTILNSFQVAYNRNDTYLLSGAPFTLSDLGVNVAAPKDVKEIRMSVAGYFGFNTSRPAPVERRSTQFSDTLYFQRDRHQISIGGEMMRMRAYNGNPYRTVGFFTFRSKGSLGTTNALADFMLGSLDQFVQGGGEFGTRAYWSRSLFVQDNYRLLPNLTLNLGLRWDPYTPPTEIDNKTSCWAPGEQSKRYPNAPLGYIYGGDAGCPDGGSTSHWGQIAPRFGFAYNVGGAGRTTVRGGIGLSYQPPFLEAFNQMNATAPYSPQINLVRSQHKTMNFGDPYGSTGTPNPFPAGFGPKIPGADATFTLPVVAVSYSHDWRPSQVWTWNLTVERQLARDLMARVGYAGSKGAHLSFNTDMNPGINGDRLNPDFDMVTQDNSGATSNYNALQMALEKRFSKGFSLGANYTWAKSMDWVSTLTDLDTLQTINPFNYRAYTAVSDFDIPHRFTLNYVWQLPSPASRKLNLLLGGWQTTGIWIWQSGFPLTITSDQDNSGSLTGNDTADLVSKPALTNGSLGNRIDQWFTTSAFVYNAPGTFGAAGRNILRGPGSFNIDFSAMKYFNLTEHLKLQYRLDMLNALNHTHFDNPDTSLASDEFGRITGAHDPRVLQMALRLEF